MDDLIWFSQLPGSAWLMFAAGIVIGAGGGYWFGHDTWLKFYQKKLIDKQAEEEKRQLAATMVWVDYIKNIGEGGQR